MLSIVAKEKRCHIIDPFREYYNAERWSRTVERNIVDDLQYTSDSLWHRMQIIYPNMQAKLPRTFKIYVHLFALVALQHDISQLATKFLDYQAYILKEIVEPLLFRRMHVPVRSIVLVVRWIYWPFQYPVQMLKGRSRCFLGVVIIRERRRGVEFNSEFVVTNKLRKMPSDFAQK